MTRVFFVNFQYLYYSLVLKRQQNLGKTAAMVFRVYVVEWQNSFYRPKHKSFQEQGHTSLMNKFVLKIRSKEP